MLVRAPANDYSTVEPVLHMSMHTTTIIPPSPLYIIQNILSVIISSSLLLFVLPPFMNQRGDKEPPRVAT